MKVILAMCLLLWANSVFAVDSGNLGRYKRQESDVPELVEDNPDDLDAPEVDENSAAAVPDGEEGAEGREAAPNVDLHNQEFCVDVSTYGEVVFESTPREKCETTFAKRCETKSDQVCDEVTEIQCEIVPYTECQMAMEATPYKSYEMVPMIYKKKVCEEGMDTVQHTKMMPECRNVTKQNCITKWEEDENGNQVWAGNEACEPVTWRECKLVPRQVDFKVPKITCEEGDEIPYTDCIDAEKTQMTTKMTCEVKHTSNCRPVVSTKCQNIQYQECSEEPIEACSQTEMMVPSQEKEHKKKCLLPSDGNFGNGGSAAPRQLRAFNGRNNAARINLQRSSQPLPLQNFEEPAESIRQTRVFRGQIPAQIRARPQHRRSQGQGQVLFKAQPQFVLQQQPRRHN